MILAAAFSAELRRSRSAGGQLEQPWDVKSSTTTGRSGAGGTRSARELAGHRAGCRENDARTSHRSVISTSFARRATAGRPSGASLRRENGRAQ